MDRPKSPIAPPGGPIGPPLYRLSVAAKKAGVTAAQLQYYLYMGVVTTPHTTRGNQRLFDEQTIKRIRLVRMMNQNGYTLRDIRQIFIQQQFDVSDQINPTLAKFDLPRRKPHYE